MGPTPAFPPSIFFPPNTLTTRSPQISPSPTQKTEFQILNLASISPVLQKPGSESPRKIHSVGRSDETQMWSPWGRSSPSVHGGAVPSPRPSFQCSSFKDVHRLYTDDDPASPRKPDPQTRPDTENHNPNPTRKPAPEQRRRKKAVFHRVRVVSSIVRNWPARAPDPARISILGAETSVIIYYTSIRAVRPTFDAYRAVKSILCGFRVKIDERDVAMDKGFLDELLRILGIGKEKLTLPAVFVGGSYVGGVEEVRHLDEVGELKKLVEGFPPADPRACEVCGGYRFVLCGECNGSRKVYADRAAGFRCCAVCNENGLIKCHACYPTALVPG